MKNYIETPRVSEILFEEFMAPYGLSDGFGLRSMKEVVERNHGAMEIRAEGERFEVFLYMPLEI